MKLTKWQKDMIAQYENLSGFEVNGKDRITNNDSFWEIWDRNIQWLRCLIEDVENIDSKYRHKRYKHEQGSD